MIDFIKNKKLLLLQYYSDLPNPWAIKKLQDDKSILLKNTFTFSPKDLYKIEIDELSDDDYEVPLQFLLAKLEGEYFKIEGSKLSIDFSIYIQKDISLSDKFFIAVKNISIFKHLSNVINEDIYIGGEKPNALPLDEFDKLLNNFPNTYELKKYANARISSILRNYYDSVIDGEQQYNNYLNKKISKKGRNLFHQFKNVQLNKFKAILSKIEEMLKNENSYNEKQWQKEILQIILLLYPKYIKVFYEAPIRDTYNSKNRSLDYLLVDSTGNTDIVEIKRPFDNCIITQNTYRDNFIPLRELSGTVMQIEKYIFYLNKWGKKGENILTEKYKTQLPKNFKIKITNPSGIIIMGRENNLSKNQQEDFEVIKRKYKNIIDIITYDELIKRLQFMIAQLEKET